VLGGTGGLDVRRLLLSWLPRRRSEGRGGRYCRCFFCATLPPKILRLCKRIARSDFALVLIYIGRREEAPGLRGRQHTKRDATLTARTGSHKTQTERASSTLSTGARRPHPRLRPPPKKRNARVKKHAKISDRPKPPPRSPPSSTLPRFSLQSVYDVVQCWIVSVPSIQQTRNEASQAYKPFAHPHQQPFFFPLHSSTSTENRRRPPPTPPPPFRRQLHMGPYPRPVVNPLEDPKMSPTPFPTPFPGPYPILDPMSDPKLAPTPDPDVLDAQGTARATARSTSALPPPDTTTPPQPPPVGLYDVHVESSLPIACLKAPGFNH
jgi:hypothetical protein